MLLVSDGQPCSDGNLPTGTDNLVNYAYGKSDFNCSGDGCPSLSVGTASFSAATFPPCIAGGNVAGLEDVALWAHTTDLRNSPAIGKDNIARTQNLTLYTVFAFGSNSTLLKFAAINGGFVDSDGSNTPNLWDEWDADHSGVPDTYFEASEGAGLERAIRAALEDILKRASSGTAASVLASGEGSGANLIQAVFYPRRRFGNNIISWTGTLQNLWYFVDPFLGNASIREETPPTTDPPKLNLQHDDIVEFFFDETTETTMVRTWNDTDGDGDKDTVNSPDIPFESLRNIWEAGTLLRLRSTARDLYTSTDGAGLIRFSVDNASLLSLASLQASSSEEREKIIRFVHGQDIYEDLNPADQLNDFRLRTISLGTDNTVWRLGDVINSTPRIVGGVPLGTYDRIYNDLTYKAFVNSSGYKNRGMVFVGGNDGMLHAIKLGKLTLSWPGQTATEKAMLSDPDPSSPLDLGDEAWAYIPRNAQPYLKYLMDPDYCHLYYTDLSPYVFDASIGGNPTDARTSTSWRTVVIGGMRTGGACRDNTASCNAGTSDCVKTPVAGQGFSSYFALDVTDPTSPSLLWEFSNPALGFATTGPAVVRVNAINPSSGLPDRSLNGKWYAVFGSGPTGPVDSTNAQFLGRSDQNVRLFVVDLRTGSLVRTIDTTIPLGFAGSMINTVADFNLDYQDDAVYLGYVKKDPVAGTWTQGGVGRLLTKAGITPSYGDPSGWEFGRVIDDVGPVTSAVVRLQNNLYHDSWIFFGSGRYYYELPPQGSNPAPVVDDPAGQRRLFGVKDPCFTLNNTACASSPSPVLLSSLTDVSDVGDVPTDSVANSDGFSGWWINLDAAGNYSYDGAASRTFRSERVITDPLATTSGLVFFTTYKPYGDECALGGKSFLWATQYNTGGAPNPSLLLGKALVQVSTASVEQINLSTAFQGDATLHRGGRRTFAIEGVPPLAQGLSLLSPPPPVKRIMHIRER
ncbi:MAG TPA: hypothetical protein VE080_00175 [Candidatus Aquicultoraceae bacterium]|nr:hypothetical protein [Candidatus Aquicultoraceae bacterium]